MERSCKELWSIGSEASVPLEEMYRSKRSLSGTSVHRVKSCDQRKKKSQAVHSKEPEFTSKCIGNITVHINI